MKRDRNRWFASAGGFSTLELLISTGMGVALLTGVMSLGTFQLTSMQNQSRQVDLQAVARDVINLFQREVRRVGFDPSCSGSFTPLVSASDRHLIFQADLDGSGSIDSAAGEYVGYFHLAELDAIYRYANNRMEPLVTGIDLGASRLRYFDGAGNEIDAFHHLSSGERANVQRIRLQLDLANSSAKGSHSDDLLASVSSDVTLRNRFFMSDTDCETPPDGVTLSSGN